MDWETVPSPRELYPDPGVRILIMMRRVLPLWQYDRLTGPFFRLYWNSTPGAVIRHADQDVALNPDRVVLVPPNTPISMRLIQSPVTHFYVHFVAFEPFSRLHSKLYVFDVRNGMLQGIETLLPDDEDRLTSRLDTVMAVHGLIAGLLSRIPPEDLEPLFLSSRLSDCVAFLDSRLRDPLSNADIARHMGVGVSAMLRQFRKELGISPREYLRRKRIERACVFLHDPRMSIEQIAAETGFCDRYHLTKAFKAMIGHGPGRYRKL